MLPRYIDIFLQATQTPDELPQSLAQQLELPINPALSQVAEVIGIYSGDPATPYHWFDLWTGLKRHSDYPYQLYVGASKYDLHGHYRVNLTGWLLEQLAGAIPLILEVGDGETQIISEAIESAPSLALHTRLLALCDAPCQQIFVDADASPSTVARQIKNDAWRMKKVNKKGSPVIAEYQTVSGLLTLESNHFWSLDQFDVRHYRYLLNGAQLPAKDFELLAKQVKAYPAKFAQDFELMN